jgi:lambda family phage tail tape measure protein
LAVGGVGGAFAGAAAGAQVGMFRQQLAGTADYAASIGKLQIALRGVVGSQSEYDAAIRAAAAATRDLNIPQEEATRGLTRLSAAVIGAGGTVADSSFAFRAMSEAIKATGGNAEQVDGALLALTQVFSKGKVSAEELNQIAERLPGTFTLFAQAAGKTGPELQKALEQGEVGLNDLMKFLALTGERYGATALEIAGSSQDAGARLTVAFQAMRLEVGKALQPLGAELQGAFAKFISEITPAVISSAKALAAAISFFTTNEAVGGLARFALQVGAVALALKALGLLVGPVKQGLAMMGAAFGTASAQAVVAQARLAALGTTVKALARSVAAPIVITVAILGAELVIKYFNRIKAARDRLTQVGSQATGEQWLREIGGNALDQQQLTGALNDVGKAYEIATTKASKLRAERDRLKKVQGFDAARVLSTLEDDLKVAEAEERLLESRYKAGIARLPNAPTAAALTGTTFPDPTGGEDKDKAADKAARDAATAAADQQRYLESFMQQQIRVADTVFQHQKDLDRQRFDLLKELTDIEAQNRINKLFGPEREAANIQEQRRQRSLDYENRILTAMNAVAAAQQKLSGAQQMATVTASAGLSTGTVANILPGTRGGPNINEGVGYGRGRLHAGQDLGVDMGDPIHARMAGEVIKAYRTGFGDAGGAVVIRYEDGRQGTYGHTLPSVAQGQMVAAGQRIATVAPDGSNTHLHYELRDALGKLINPINALTASLKVPAGRQATGVAAQQRRNVTDTGDVALAGLDVTQAEATLANLTAQRDRFNAAFNQEQINALTASLTTQNNELEKTITLETRRFDLVLKGYSEERIALEQKFDQARIARDAALTGVTPGDESQVLAINTAYERQIALLQQLYDAQTQFNSSFGAGFQTGVQQYVQSLGTMNQAAAQLTQSGLKGIEDTLFSLVTTGTANFREFAAEILKQSARMVLQLTIQRIIMQIVGAIGGGASNLGSSAANVAQYAPLPNAMGNAYAKNNIVPYAMGGVVGKPTLFKFAAGGTMRTGLMGEAGPEAIMPLKRGPDGKLGVAGGGGSTSVVVNVDASGSSQVSGNPGQGAALGRAVSQAVQAELIKQRRPGGLLAA